METVIDYYPFGAEHQNPEIGTQPKPCYRFSGKEEAESYYQYSPYSYCANNPTNLIDSDGERIFATFYDGKSWVDYEFMFGDILNFSYNGFIIVDQKYMRPILKL
ncbi:MAG: hypothetical protein E7071_07480 [Bacteroidales bacterium]|nr:hypothetical protein [Bacteroidales bacterium]